MVGNVGGVGFFFHKMILKSQLIFDIKFSKTHKN